MPTTLTRSAHPVNHAGRRDVTQPHGKILEDSLRRAAGSAYARIAASGERIKRALRLHHSSVSHRKSGSGPLANLLIEVAALERSGIDTTPLLEAVIDVQANARGPVAICPAAMARDR